MYAVYHGPGRAARRSPGGCTGYAAVLAAGLRAGGVEVVHDAFFDTVHGAGCRAGPPTVVAAAARARGQPAPGRRRPRRRRLRRDDHAAGTSPRCGPPSASTCRRGRASTRRPRTACRRRAATSTSSPTRSSTRTARETAMLRYLRRLADKDYALDRGDDPARLVHDEAQRHHRDGAGHLARVRRHAPVRAGRAGRRLPRADRATWSAGWPRSPATTRSSLQPNAGSQGELAGLLAIRAYHRARGDGAARRLPDPVVARTAPTRPAR